MCPLFEEMYKNGLFNGDPLVHNVHIYEKKYIFYLMVEYNIPLIWG
jgi:hypothetical protein